ncbi:MAG: hypothetical protein WA667_04430 [Candidatus Nitrosopolaris sp.]
MCSEQKKRLVVMPWWLKVACAACTSIGSAMLCATTGTDPPVPAVLAPPAPAGSPQYFTIIVTGSL